MLRAIFSHGWKQLRRAPTWNQNIVLGVFLGLLAFFFAVQFLTLGFFAENIIAELFPDRDPIQLVGVFLIYYFLLDIVIRLIMQKYPFLDVKPYLIHPIRKSTLIHSLLLKSLRSFFNYFPLFIIIPFAIKSVFPLSFTMGLTFLIFFWGLIFFNNFLSFLLDKYFKTKPVISVLITATLLVVLYLDFTGTIALRDALMPVVQAILELPLTMFLPWMVAGIIYYTLYQTLIKHLYLEDYLSGQQVSDVRPLRFGIFSQFGEAGKLMDLEVKLIWRNKRSRSILYISAIFILYPLIFIGSEDIMQMMWFKLFLGLFVTGAFALNYGQLMLSWNSPHFDLLLARGFKVEHIFQAKYYLLASSCAFLFLFAMLYGIMDRSFLVIVPVMLLFNVGVSIFLYMIMASFNSKRIDPSKGAVMNYEGIGAGHFLIMIPLILLPYLFYLPFSLMGYPNMGIAFIGFIGLMGFIFHRQLIRMATHLFIQNKYRIAAAFRKTA